MCRSNESSFAQRYTVRAGSPTFSGTYENSGIVMALSAGERAHGYTGSISFKGESLSVSATAADAWLVGDFRNKEGGTVPFRAKLVGDKLTLEVNDRTFPLTRQAQAAAPASTSRQPSAEVLDAAFNVLQFRMGLLYDQFDFKMPNSHAVKYELIMAWRRMSAQQQRKLNGLPAKWKLLQRQWNQLTEAQKRTFAANYQKKWVAKTTRQARRGKDAATRARAQKQLDGYRATRKKLAQAHRGQAAKSASKKKRTTRRDAARYPSAAEWRTRIMQQEMLNQSQQMMRNARMTWWDYELGP